MEDLIACQEEVMKQLERSLINFKKTPQARLTKTYIQVKLGLLEDNWKTFGKNHVELVKNKDKEIEDYFTSDAYSQAEDNYIMAKCKMLEKLEELSPPPSHLHNVATMPQITLKGSEQAQTEIKLPRINLPTFSGNYSEWTSFHDLFLSLIHHNSSLQGVQKLHYLKASLSGEAEALLRHVPVTETNYTDAWETLKKRYNNKRFIVNALLKKLMSQRTLNSESSHAIKMLLDTTNECLSGLKNIDVTTCNWDPILVYIIVSKMDSESVKQWEQQITGSEKKENSLPTYKDLCYFLEARFRTLEVLETSKSSIKYTKQAYHTSSVDNTFCTFCNENHLIHYCKEFARQSYTDRKAFVERNGLCYNCLIPNHIVFRCRQRSSCKRCGRKHHSLLHPENEQAPVEGGTTPRPREYSQPPASEQPVDEDLVTHFANRELANSVLLATAVVKVYSQNGTPHFLRALIDQGSQGSFITESAAQLLGLNKISINCVINGLGDNGRSLNSKNMVLFKAHSKYDKEFSTPVKAYILKSLTKMLPARQIHNTENWTHLYELDLADPNYDKPDRVDLLLGADVYSELIRDGLRKGPKGSPVAQNTYLGWILTGQLQEDISQSYTITLSMHMCIEENKLLQKFWEIESDVTNAKIMTEEEQRCEKIFHDTYTRDESGRYITELPFKEDNPQCQYGESKDVCIKRLMQLERRLQKDDELKEEYSKTIKNYIDLKYLEEIVVEKDKNKETAVYLPHHAVVRKDKATTKVRIVHDASCKYKNNVSLNDDLMVGPTLQQDLRHIIMRWRIHKVCLVADIVKMYHQIRVTDRSADYQRLLWRENPNDEIKHYRMTRVTFGTASAPYLATKVLQQLATDEKSSYPVASIIAMTDFYMDDLLCGGDKYEDVILIYKQMTTLLKSGGFLLQKWNSNDPNIRQYIKLVEADEPEKKNRCDSKESRHDERVTPEKKVKETEPTTKELNLDMTVKTLGIIWNNNKDQFGYSIDLPITTDRVTKRSIASTVSKLFDPMGWLAPTIIIGKVFLQRLWLSGVSWDQEVNRDIKDDWLKFQSELPRLSEIVIDRWLHTSATAKLELYGFADASNIAYAAVVFARVVDKNGDIHIHLLSGKTKVAPVKTISIPRLELCGAQLLARLLNEIAEQLNVSRDDIYAYTDSKVVLCWLQGHPSKWKTFVSNRTSEIISILPSKHWNHVSSKDNPADLASRGVHASKLKDENLWWNGPTWLRDKEISHDVPTDLPSELKIDERVVHFAETDLTNEFTQIVKRFSTLEKLIRIIARCKRFGRVKSKKLPSYLTAEEMKDALFQCVLQCQQEEFSEDIWHLRNGRPLKNSSKLRSLNPFLDDNGILRVGGRLRHANIPEEAKHQIILPNGNTFSKLIIAQCHKKTLHGGPNLMQNCLRQNYWILGGKSMINQEVHKCVICARYKATTRTQLMADLPKPRVTPTRPFLHSGIDFAGPIDLRMSKGRGCKTYKGYICIFICMATKAIHIEIVSSLDSESFVAAFKRFTARRGHCSDIWSDNATNFTAGNKLLAEMLKGQTETVKTEILDYLARDGTTWHNIPAAAPHFGGLWEAGVRSIKHHLKRTLGNSTLTYEEMATATSQVEACLNSRPISSLSNNIDDFLPLTPGHFLIGEPPIVVPERSYLESNINRLNRWQLVQRTVQHFWDRWKNEYLNRLQQRPKWTKTIDNNIKIGMLVLVKDENLPPAKWPLARIVDLHPGPDGLVRVVSLKYKNSIVKRPITKICVLPIEA